MTRNLDLGSQLTPNDVFHCGRATSAVTEQNSREGISAFTSAGGTCGGVMALRGWELSAAGVRRCLVTSLALGPLKPGVRWIPPGRLSQQSRGCGGLSAISSRSTPAAGDTVPGTDGWRKGDPRRLWASRLLSACQHQPPALSPACPSWFSASADDGPAGPALLGCSTLQCYEQTDGSTEHTQDQV